jgi:hypothetical protein
MATRSRIGIKTGDTVRHIYCHWDGYPENNGKILLNHYTTPEKVNELIDGGNLSVLAENINTDLPHSWAKPVDGVCVYYGRDRGETGQMPKKCYPIEYRDSAVDHLYLFDTDNNKWHIDTNLGVFIELTPRICKCD